MRKMAMNLRNMLAIAISLVGVALFSGCEKEDDENSNKPIEDTTEPTTIGDENNITFTDSRGNEVIIPYGAMSCATKVISFTHGTPWTNDERAQEANEILGAPNYDKIKDVNYVTLGAFGEIVLEFGVYITDGKGNDIYVFEIGPDVEATKIEVSDDLENWIYVGDADGSLSGVDMNGKVPVGAKYRYVRLTDIKGESSSWSGADIDAVAAVHPVKIGGGNIGDNVEYTDTRGNKVIVPGGALSCATFVVDFTHGIPWTSDPKAMDTEKTIGAPDYNASTDENYVTLGADGVIVLGFNVYITDGEENDIYIFEIGPAVEATKVEVSNDLENWIYVGDANGSLSGVDMNGKVPAGAKYKYVRLTDLRTDPTSDWPGADIDAVAVTHPALD
jgi:hypothetical protein